MQYYSCAGMVGGLGLLKHLLHTHHTPRPQLSNWTGSHIRLHFEVATTNWQVQNRRSSTGEREKAVMVTHDFRIQFKTDPNQWTGKWQIVPPQEVIFHILNIATFKSKEGVQCYICLILLVLTLAEREKRVASKDEVINKKFLSGFHLYSQTCYGLYQAFNDP